MNSRKDPIRPVILGLEPSGISKVTALGLGNPDVLPLWFGETDLVTPPFIREAAIKALEDGKTFYTNARGIQPLREAIRDFHKRTVGADIGLELFGLVEEQPEARRRHHRGLQPSQGRQPHRPSHPRQAR